MTPEALRERIPLLAQARTLALSPLAGVVSLNNTNYKLTAEGSEYLLRLGVESARYLGIRRDEEQAAVHATGWAGIAPPLLFGDGQGLLLQPFVSGRHWSQAEAQEPQNILQIAQTLRRLHRLTDVAAPCSVYARIERLLESAATLGQTLPAGFAAVQTRLAAFRAQRATDTRFGHGLCHGDFWLNNFLVEDGESAPKLWLLDWEFAGIGDGLYDLATIALGAGYSPEQQQALLTAYGYTAPGDLASLEQMKAVVYCFEGLWALVQHGLRGSEAGFSYLGYAQQSLEKCQEAAQHLG